MDATAIILAAGDLTAYREVIRVYVRAGLREIERAKQAKGAEA